MSLEFLWPLGLAALAAMLVPLLIHLRRRSEQHRTAFAALRWLPSRARPRTRLRFEEWPLLLVRLLLLVALAFLLAQPVLFGGPHARRWLVVVPGADTSHLQPRGKDEGERRWLAPGFPSLEEVPPTQPQPVASLLRELDATLPADTQITVVVPAQLDGADAVAPVLHRPVQWQVVANAKPVSAKGSDRATPRPPLVIRHAEGVAGLRYLRAAAIAWQAATPASGKAAMPADVASIDRPLPATDKPLAWLAPGPPPSALLGWVENGGSVLVDAQASIARMQRDGVPLWQDEDGAVLVRGIRQGRGRILQWTRPLTPEAVPQLLQPDFPDHLWSLFAPPTAAPARIAAADYAPRTGGRAWPVRPNDLQPWLLLLIAALFLLERFLASGRREVVRA